MRKRLQQTKALQEVVRRIVKAVNPQKVVLFGSYARGDAGQESDVDLLVVMFSSEPRHKRALPIYRALRGVKIPLDIIVYTPEEIAEWSEVRQAFVTTALREGIVLYEKEQARSGTGLA